MKRQAKLFGFILGGILLMNEALADMIIPTPIEIVKEDPFPWFIVFLIVGFLIFFSVILLRKIKKSRQLSVRP